MKLLIKGGRVIDPDQDLEAEKELLLEDGKIAAVLAPGTGPADAEVIEAAGCWVVPGLIDMHVHLREPGQEYKETIATGAAAAIAGGLAAVACMANTQPTNDTAAVTDYVLEKAARAGKARVYPVGAVSHGLEGEGLAELGELSDHGCVAFSDDGRPIKSAALMRHALEYCLALGAPILSHCEELSLSDQTAMHEGPVGTRLGLAGAPSAAEEIMVARDLLLAEMTGGKLHLQHLSTAGSVRLVREAKARGVKITCETCPHYFTLADQDIKNYDPNFKMNPPLRAESDRQAILNAIADGTIDCIASDHAPHSLVEKQVEFDKAANGIVGLETIVPLSLDLVRAGLISAKRWVRLLSTNPAKVLGVPGGALQPGAIADVSIIDPHADWTVDRDRFVSKGRNTPFHGRKVKGKARAVIVGGKIVRP